MRPPRNHLALPDSRAGGENGTTIFIVDTIDALVLCRDGEYESVPDWQAAREFRRAQRSIAWEVSRFASRSQLFGLRGAWLSERDQVELTLAAIEHGDLVGIRPRLAGAASDSDSTREQQRLVRQIEALGRLVESGRQYKLVAGTDLNGIPNRNSYEVVPRDEARRVLDSIVRQPVGLGGPGSSDLHRHLEKARDGLAKDWRPPFKPEGLVLLRRVVSASATVRDTETPITPSQMRKLLLTDWIEIEIVRENGKPYTGRYSLELPDGTTNNGTLGEKGFLSNRNLETGMCQLSLPDLRLRIDTEAPKDGAKEEVPITVAIKAENGADAAPVAVALGGEVKLKALPSKGTGDCRWQSSSSKVTLTNATSDLVTVKGMRLSEGTAEAIRLVFTPAGTSALAPIEHAIKVGGAAFTREASHPWGYDVYGPIRCKDKNNATSTDSPQPAKDILSIKSGQTGKVKVELQNLAPSDVFFTSKDTEVCEPKVTQPTAQPYVLEIVAKAKDWAETDVEARLGSVSGPVLAKVGVVVAKEAAYTATLFHVKDSRSPNSALQIPLTATDVETYLNSAYQHGVAAWRLSGGGDVDIQFDGNNNGALDMEPGTTSTEASMVAANCPGAGQRIVHVHELNWAFYLANDAVATDTVIKIKIYAALKFIGTKSYVIQDSAGHRQSITVRRVNQTTGEVTLTGAIGQEFKVSDKAALMFPLAGLSGNPIWVKDLSSAEALKNVIAHELGHSVGRLGDSGEINNLMYGGPDNNLGLRRRGIKLYYDRPTREEQWKKMPR
jgi:hypothetical protein